MFLSAEVLGVLLRERSSVFLAPRRPHGAEARESEDDLGAALEVAWGSLSELDQRVFTLRYIDGHSLREAAGELGVSESTYRGQLHRATTSLREALAQVAPGEVQPPFASALHERRDRRALAQWLDQLDGDEPVDLLRPASHYVEEGRAATS